MSQRYIYGTSKMEGTKSGPVRSTRPSSPGTARTSRSSLTMKNTQRKPEQPNISSQVQTYIANLQGQIHLLEMETKILKEKVANGAGERGSIFGGADDMDVDVDPTMRELRRLYLKLEQDWKDERAVC